MSFIGSCLGLHTACDCYLTVVVPCLQENSLSATPIPPCGDPSNTPAPQGGMALDVVTPLQPVSPGTMVTPDEQRTYTHVSI